jgi:RNA polymerase sigma-70 factor (ECF subfamily)
VSGERADEAPLVEALRRGDEAAFTGLVDRYHGQMVRLAAMYVPSRDVAEEVAQQAWLGALKGLEQFEGRASLKTWLFRILVYTAKSRGYRERRTIPFSSLGIPAGEPAEPSVDADRFLAADDPWWPRHWAAEPASWEGIPEERLLSGEVRGLVEDAIAGLSPNQREVITMRDVLGWSSEEVCNALNISETNQRVLLHRARSKVRRALERYLEEEVATA